MEFNKGDIVILNNGFRAIITHQWLLPGALEICGLMVVPLSDCESENHIRELVKASWSTDGKYVVQSLCQRGWQSNDHREYDIKETIHTNIGRKFLNFLMGENNV